MNRLRIAVADDEPLMRKYFHEVLSGLGHEVVGVAENGRKLVDDCRQWQPDLVITDLKMPELDGIEAMAEICRCQPVPAVLISAYHMPDILDSQDADCVFSYLIKPVKQHDIQPAISVAMKRFEQLKHLRQELRESQQQLENRKKIERAKGVLMRRNGLDEEAAFRHLIRVARDANMKVADLAETILLSDEAFKVPAPLKGRPPAP
jgi:response regulator NasT